MVPPEHNMPEEGSSPGDGETPPHRSEPPWEPYEPPHAGRRGSVAQWLRRNSFSVAVGVAILIISGLLLFAPYPNPGGSSAEGEEATLSVYSVPGNAAVVLGGDTVGMTPLNNHRVQPGAYRVSVGKENYRAEDTVLTLQADQSAVFFPQLRQQTVVTDREQGTTQEPSSAQDPLSAPALDSPEEEQGGQASEQSSPAGGGAVSEQTPPTEPPAQEESPTLEPGTLELRAEPESTAVELDGQPAGATPMTLDGVPPGLHEVTFSRAGHESVTRQFEIEPGETVTVGASLEAQTGFLRVLVRPWGSIFIGEERRAEDTDVWYETEMSVGTHRVTARHPTLGQKEQRVEVVPGDTQSVVIDLQE